MLKEFLTKNLKKYSIKNIESVTEILLNILTENKQQEFNITVTCYNTQDGGIGDFSSARYFFDLLKEIFSEYTNVKVKFLAYVEYSRTPIAQNIVNSHRVKVIDIKNYTSTEQSFQEDPEVIIVCSSKPEKKVEDFTSYIEKSVEIKAILNKTQCCFNIATDFGAIHNIPKFLPKNAYCHVIYEWGFPVNQILPGIENTKQKIFYSYIGLPVDPINDPQAEGLLVPTELIDRNIPNSDDFSVLMYVKDNISRELAEKLISAIPSFHIKKNVFICTNLNIDEIWFSKSGKKVTVKMFSELTDAQLKQAMSVADVFVSSGDISFFESMNSNAFPIIMPLKWKYATLVNFALQLKTIYGTNELYGHIRNLLNITAPDANSERYQNIPKNYLDVACKELSQNYDKIKDQWRIFSSTVKEKYDAFSVLLLPIIKLLGSNKILTDEIKKFENSHSKRPDLSFTPGHRFLKLKIDQLNEVLLSSITYFSNDDGKNFEKFIQETFYFFNPNTIIDKNGESVYSIAVQFKATKCISIMDEIMGKTPEQKTLIKQQPHFISVQNAKEQLETVKNMLQDKTNQKWISNSKGDDNKIWVQYFDKNTATEIKNYLINNSQNMLNNENCRVSKVIGQEQYVVMLAVPKDFDWSFLQEMFPISYDGQKIQKKGIEGLIEVSKK